MTDQQAPVNPEVLETETYKRARPTRHDIISFVGDGREYFSILILNGILTLLTLGIYYPWAKVARMKYLYSHTTLAGDPLTFTATGKEYFYGFIKAIFILGAWYGSYFYLLYAMQEQILGPSLFLLYFLIWMLVGMAFYPVIIHGSYRYRMSRTRWRGIRFAYLGNRTELIKKTFKWGIITFLTLGFYSYWFTINLRTYIIDHLRLGNAKFKYVGKGGDYFVLVFFQSMLIPLTLGIYIFWYYRNLIRFYVDNMRLELDGEQYQFQFQGTATDIISLGIGNVLILIFTLGLGYPWVVTRTLKTIFNNISLYGDVDLDKIAQMHGDAGDGTADDIMDFFEMDIVI